MTMRIERPLLGVNSSIAHGRRHRPGAAAAAYSLALAVTGNADLAASIAAASLRKGAGSRTAVMAHARKESISAARSSPELLDQPVSTTDLRELAQQLAATRSPIERTIVNLELRSGLDAGSFSRALGLTTSRTVARSREVANNWTRDLDPAVMAWLGPGSCEDLAVILREQRVWPRNAENPVVASVDSTGPIPILRTGTDGAVLEPLPAPTPASEISIGTLLDVAPIVHTHAQTCDICAERLRLLTPVRTLVGQIPLEDVPSKVAEAARNARRRLPAPLPPSIEHRRLDYTRLAVPAFGVAAALVILSVGALVYKVNRPASSEPSQAARVQQLVQNAPISELLATPTIVTPGIKTASLANNGTKPINWHISTNVSWITLSPSSGRIQPSQSISIVVNTMPANGATDATLTVTGDDGSVQTMKYDADGG